MIEDTNINIFELKEITQQILTYYRDNLAKAELDYSKLVKNDRGLDKSKLDYYTEKHHIIPKCMGGEDKDDNYVLLTYEEHIKAHLLLYVLHSENIGLTLAFKTMASIRDLNDLSLKIDLTVIEELRIKFSEYMKGDNNPMKNPEIAKKFSGDNSPMKRKEIRSLLSENMKLNNPMKNPETVEKMRKSKIGRKTSKSHRLAMSEGHLNSEKREMSKETRTKISEIRKAKNLHLSEESKEKMRQSKRARYVDSEGNIYNSLTELGKKIGISRTTAKKWIEDYPEKGFKILL